MTPAIVRWAMALFSAEDVPGRVAVAAAFTPDPARTAVYDRLYAEFVKISGLGAQGYELALEAALARLRAA